MASTNEPAHTHAPAQFPHQAPAPQSQPNQGDRGFLLLWVGIMILVAILMLGDLLLALFR